jgi:hypothetical protein
MRHLLDINFLIALLDPDHAFHRRAHGCGPLFPGGTRKIRAFSPLEANCSPPGVDPACPKRAGKACKWRDA